MTEHKYCTVELGGRNLIVHYTHTVQKEERTLLNGDPGLPEYHDIVIVDVLLDGNSYLPVLQRASDIYNVDYLHTINNKI